MPPNIGLFDVCLASFYLIIIYIVCFRFQQKSLALNPEYKYFIYGLSAKITGAIVFVLFSIYYFKGGDTFRYFEVAENLRTLFNSDFQNGLKLFFTPFYAISDADYFMLGFPNRYYERSTTWFFSRVLCLINVFSFGSYLVSSIIISFISFISLWLGYISFARIYRQVQGVLFVPFFLIPTAIFWSSGVLRDTLIVGCFSLVLFALVSSKKQIIYQALIGVAALGLILLLKPILFIVLFGCGCFYLGLFFLKKRFYVGRKIVMMISIIVIVTIVGFGLNRNVLKENSKYQVENLMQTLQGFHSIHPDEIIPNSRYTLGELDYTAIGVVKKMPEAINVTFFRPYFWNVSSIELFVAAVEAFLLFLCFVWLLIVVNKRIFKIIKDSSMLAFMLLFSISFAFITGLSAYNFGSLTRFKIPAVLCLSLALIIIYAKNKEVKANEPLTKD